MTAAPAAGLTVLERGWLSSNNVLLHGDGGGAVLIDSGHVLHGAQTLALVRAALCDEPLAQIVNTHLHSDHCGGNAALVRSFGCSVAVPSGQWDAVADWDEQALSYKPTAQRCERFEATDRLAPGAVLAVGRQRWQVLAAPGHDPHSLILFEDRDGVVITADALWESGFGVVFPELDGERAFDAVEQTLALIESLGARQAIPGHGAPFSDIGGALQRARQRLAAFQADPQRHARHALKALLKYHLLEEQRQTLPDLQSWFSTTPLFATVWSRLGRPAGTLPDYAVRLVDELCASGVLALRDGIVCNE
jgi:glyoxylase-like metal-dependent hydrolase (beta-lactamase superfamily II)